MVNALNKTPRFLRVCEYTACLILMAVCFTWFLAEPTLQFIGYGFGINRSPSAKLGIYWISPLPSTVSVGDLITLRLPDQAWLHHRDYGIDGRPLVKTVMAISGDHLFTKSREVFVCSRARWNTDCHSLGHCLEKDSQGQPIPCQQWRGDVIPNDYYYVGSQRVFNALDSRYFGLVPRHLLENRVKLLWAF